MAGNPEKLRTLKELVDRDESFEEPQGRAERDEKIEDIIKRLKERESERRKAAREVSGKIAGIKERVEGSSSEVIKYRERDISETEISSTGPGNFAAIGKIYEAFRAPLTSIAGLVSNFSTTRGLKNSLDSANLNTRPEEYIIVVSTIATLTAVSFLFVFVSLGVALEDPALAVMAPVAAFAGFVLAVVGGMAYPGARAQERAHRIDRELPFALRQLATQVKAGVSFYKSLSSISNSRYGALSEEIQRVLKDIDRGTSTDVALSKLAERTKSRGLKKAVMQILRALKLGGNLSQTITSIANDVSFELRMKVRDFTEKLNFISVVYVMVAVVGPVVITILSSIAQLPLIGGNFPFIYIVAVFLSIGIMMGILLFTIKRMEPS